MESCILYACRIPSFWDHRPEFKAHKWNFPEGYRKFEFSMRGLRYFHQWKSTVTFHSSCVLHSIQKSQMAKSSLRWRWCVQYLMDGGNIIMSRCQGWNLAPIVASAWVWLLRTVDRKIGHPGQRKTNLFSQNGIGFK